MFAMFLIAGWASFFPTSEAQAVVANVLQVEAPETTTSNVYQYAPVNFAGSTSVTSGGITYHALNTGSAYIGSSSVTTKSGHASTVCSRLLSADSSDTISDIYCQYAGDFLEDYVQTSVSSYMAAQPTSFGNNIKIVNNSWVYNYILDDATNGTALNIDAVRRIDYMIQREDLVMVNGAVSPITVTVSGVQKTVASPLTWASRNGISVRGTQGFTGAHASGIGKTHADLWGPETSAGADEASSFETPGVAGYAASLIAAADSKGWSNGTNGLRHEVVKSVLMTGASKTNFSSNGFTSWTRDTTNNLDTDSGAGRVDYSTSLAVLNGGKQEFSTVSGTTVSSPAVTSSTCGWWYEDAISSSGTQALIVDLTNSTLTGLTATLAWDVTQATTTLGATTYLNTTDSGQEFANLDLKLVSVTKSGNAYTLGNAVNITGATSASTDDNLEHLYFTGSSLAAGLYAFVISNSSTFSWNYGFSYNMATVTLPIPEPGAFVLLLTGGLAGWMLWRRRSSVTPRY